LFNSNFHLLPSKVQTAFSNLERASQKSGKVVTNFPFQAQSLLLSSENLHADSLRENIL